MATHNLYILKTAFVSSSGIENKVFCFQIEKFLITSVFSEMSKLTPSGKYNSVYSFRFENGQKQIGHIRRSSKIPPKIWRLWWALVV